MTRLKRKANEPFLAELDQAMNYCEYFVRDEWNDGRYIRDWKEYKVNWLWDYKTTPDHFKEWFKKEFWHLDYFKLHNRYN